MNPNQSQSSNMHKQSYDFSNSVGGGNQNMTHQMSYQDTLSRDEDADNDIREQIRMA